MYVTALVLCRDESPIHFWSVEVSTHMTQAIQSNSRKSADDLLDQDAIAYDDAQERRVDTAFFRLLPVFVTLISELGFVQNMIDGVNTIKVKIDELLHLIMWRQQVAEEERLVMNREGLFDGYLLQPLEPFKLL